MIARIRGPLLEKTPDYVVVEAGGVGYRLEISLHTFYDLPDENEEARLLVHTHSSQDAITLFGFTATAEREMFRRLITISGIGPKLARNILSGIRVPALSEALRAGDTKRINAVPGVGKKLAQRILMELREKEEVFPATQAETGAAPADPVTASVVSALVNLGYRQEMALKTVESVRGQADAPDDLEGLLRAALQTLAR